MSTVSCRNSAILAGVIALATASHIEHKPKRIHRDCGLPMERELQDTPSQFRHRNGITDECIWRKACELG